MGFYLPIVFIPALLVVLFSKLIWKRDITIKEWGLQLLALLAGSVISIGLIYSSTFALTGDFSIFNGYVTDKASVKVSCSHQYVCGETCSNVSDRDSKGNVTTRRVCEPVYCDEHDYDIDWDVHTTLGTWTIDRIDRRGVREPPRWGVIDPGEPVAESRYVSNYMLLDDDRFKTDPNIMEKFKGKLFEYPKPFDYYRFNRVVQDNGGDYDGINIWLNNKLRKDGADKQLNIILVVTQNDADFYYAQMEYWKGARKNDVILFYGVDDDEKIQWSRAISFADGQNNQILLSSLSTMTYGKNLTDQLVQEQYAKIVQDFTRIPNSKFEYMREGYTPPTWWVLIVSLINLLFAIGAAWFVIKEDVA